MALIDATTNVDLHMIALYSLAAMTSAMANFVIALPVDHNPASEDDIETFDALLDEMEE
jgi:hypothetical protein